MNIYNLNQAMLDCIDENGEVDIARLQELQMQRDTKIESIALWVKDLAATADALKKEIDTLDKRKKSAENKAESLKNYLEQVLNGEKFETSKVSCSYRKSSYLYIEDEHELSAWLQNNNRSDLLSFSAPKLKKLEIKECLKNNEKIKGAQICERKSFQIK